MPVKVDAVAADTNKVNTIVATSKRVPRPALIGIVVLVAAFAVLMVARVGLQGSSTTTVTPVTTTPQASAPKRFTTTPAKPKVVLLPGLPDSVARSLRRSPVTVVSLYMGQAPGDHPWLTAARTGARQAGAGFVAYNVGSDKDAAAMASFAGAVSSPAMLVVRRPGKIVTQITGPVESAVVAQAAHNAGSRR